MQYTQLSYFFYTGNYVFLLRLSKIWAYTTINAPNPKLHCKGRTFHHYQACTVYKPYKASLYNNVLISRDLQNIKGRVVVGWIVTMLGSSRVGLVCHWERSGLGAKNGSWNKKTHKIDPICLQNQASDATMCIFSTWINAGHYNIALPHEKI